MKRLNLETMTVDQLVERFVEVTLAQDDALLDVELSKFKRLFGEMRAILEELKSRPGDQRTALVRLYDYPNFQEGRQEYPRRGS